MYIYSAGSAHPGKILEPVVNLGIVTPLIAQTYRIDQLGLCISLNNPCVPVIAAGTQDWTTQAGPRICCCPGPQALGNLDTLACTWPDPLGLSENENHYHPPTQGGPRPANENHSQPGLLQN